MPRSGGGGRKLRSGKEIDRLEKKTEQELKKLGLFEEGMTAEEQKRLLKVVKESKEVFAMEEAARKFAEEFALPGPSGEAVAGGGQQVETDKDQSIEDKSESEDLMAHSILSPSFPSSSEEMDLQMKQTIQVVLNRLESPVTSPSKKQASPQKSSSPQKEKSPPLDPRPSTSKDGNPETDESSPSHAKAKGTRARRRAALYTPLTLASPQSPGQRKSRRLLGPRKSDVPMDSVQKESEDEQKGETPVPPHHIMESQISGFSDSEPLLKRIKRVNVELKRVNTDLGSQKTCPKSARLKRNSHDASSATDDDNDKPVWVCDVKCSKRSNRSIDMLETDNQEVYDETVEMEAQASSLKETEEAETEEAHISSSYREKDSASSEEMSEVSEAFNASGSEEFLPPSTAELSVKKLDNFGAYISSVTKRFTGLPLPPMFANDYLDFIEGRRDLTVEEAQKIIEEHHQHLSKVEGNKMEMVPWNVQAFRRAMEENDDHNKKKRKFKEAMKQWGRLVMRAEEILFIPPETTTFVDIMKRDEFDMNEVDDFQHPYEERDLRHQGRKLAREKGGISDMEENSSDIDWAPERTMQTKQTKKVKGCGQAKKLIKIPKKEVRQHNLLEDDDSCKIRGERDGSPDLFDIRPKETRVSKRGKARQGTKSQSEEINSEDFCCPGCGTMLLTDQVEADAAKAEAELKVVYAG
ncbi:unnamed protein product [Darwinula stevensoni]|uniref:Uncharacterized protein n=1 Tax=Darwinula stevensoni TaxID=69355 RepID=A0A7R8X4U2_9CRUS|nr:unnamed protein product [Darwinula stevensoni]CAG0883892.1 unnamed protein product [Darwinula stevensoni]